MVGVQPPPAPGWREPGDSPAVAEAGGRAERSTDKVFPPHQIPRATTRLLDQFQDVRGFSSAVFFEISVEGALAIFKLA